MTVLCCLLSLAFAGPSGSGDTGTKTASGTTADTGSAGGTTSPTTSTGTMDTGPTMVSAASLADEVGGCHCDQGSTGGAAPAAALLLLALVRRRDPHE